MTAPRPLVAALVVAVAVLAVALAVYLDRRDDVAAAREAAQALAGELRRAEGLAGYARRLEAEMRRAGLLLEPGSAEPGALRDDLAALVGLHGGQIRRSESHREQGEGVLLRTGIRLALTVPPSSLGQLLLDLRRRRPALAIERLFFTVRGDRRPGAPGFVTRSLEVELDLAGWHWPPGAGGGVP